MADKKVMLTADGYRKKVEELDYLKSVRKIEIAERLKAAIALGDLSENSEYDDAKNEQALLEGQIAVLERDIRNAEIIKDVSGDAVQMGSKVLLKDMEYGDLETFMIVGSVEADPDEGKISNESPLGTAIIGQKAGTVVDVHAPSGVLKYEIVEVIHE